MEGASDPQKTPPAGRVLLRGHLYICFTHFSITSPIKAGYRWRPRAVGGWPRGHRALVGCPHVWRESRVCRGSAHTALPEWPRLCVILWSLKKCYEKGSSVEDLRGRLWRLKTVLEVLSRGFVFLLNLYSHTLPFVPEYQVWGSILLPNPRVESAL